MKSKVNQEQNQSTESASASMDDFNFEQWARLVRPQLLASLQKRGK